MGNPRTTIARWWLPVVAGLLGLAGTAALYYTLREHDAEHARRINSLAATSIRNDMEADLNMHFLSQLEQLNPGGPPVRVPRRDWEDEARLFLKLNPAFVSVEFVDAETRGIWSAPPRPQEPPVAAEETIRRLVEAVETAPRGLALSSPGRVPDGERIHQLVVPARRSGKLEGFVVAWIRVKGLLDVVLDDATTLGYCISVREDEEEIFRIPAATAGCGQIGEFVEVHSMPLNWQARIWPMEHLVAEMRSRAPGLALILGICFSFLLALTTYFAESAQVRNASLVAEIAQRQKTEEELHRTQREMESRVDARTADLSKLSAELLELRDQERRRVSHQLQEGTAQHLAAVALNLAVLEQLADSSNENVRAAFQRSMKLIEQSCDELGDLAAVLHPPLLDHLGLASALRWYAEGVQMRTGLRVDVDLQPELGRLSRELELAVFRIAQDALSLLHEYVPNSPARLDVYSTGGAVVLDASVQRDDETKEFQPAALERGMAGMRERAKQLGGTLQTHFGPLSIALRAELPLGTPDSGEPSTRIQ